MTAPQDSKPADKDSASVSLNGLYDVFPSRTIPRYDNGPAKAHVAKGVDGKSVIALVCDRSFFPRIELAQSWQGVSNTSVARLMAHGLVNNWPNGGGQRYVFIYEDSLGDPLMENLQHPGMGMRQDILLNAVIRPVVSVLADLQRADIFHGALRPNNLFRGVGAKLERVIVGDALAVSPSSAQPVLYETIERGMADPMGRGLGLMADDLYALGVNIAVLLRQHDPMAGYTDEQILTEKIEQGSYAALLGNERLTGGMLELLRGLLHDDWRQRWTLEEVQAWLDGRRMTPKQGVKRARASRHFIFGGQKYFRPQVLSMAMYRNTSDSLQVVESGDLRQWVGRALEDPAMDGRLEKAIEGERDSGRSGGGADRLVSKICMALDPVAPLRFRGVSVLPGGVGSAMAHAIAMRQDIKPYADILTQQLMQYWVGNNLDQETGDAAYLTSRFESCRNFLRTNSAGNGLERCLYFLYDDAPCMSEKLSGYFVATSEHLVWALEDMSASSARPEGLLDRHIIAFLSVREPRAIDSVLADLGSSEKYRQVLGTIHCLANIQKRHRIKALPGITRWLAEFAEPLFGRFHDRDLRGKIKSKVASLRESGDVAAFVKLLDDPETVNADQMAFMGAMNEYHYLKQEKGLLMSKLAQGNTYGRGTGREVAAIVSGVISVIIIMAFLFIFFSGGKVT